MNSTTHTRIARSILAGAMLAACSAGAQGGILLTTANVSQIAPPDSVIKDALTSPDTAFVFAERTDLVLGADLAVDIAGAGTFTSVPGGPAPVIGTGTLIDSFYLHYDVAGNATGDISGIIVFDTDIAGIIADQVTLFATNDLLGAPGTSYPPSGSAQGIFDSLNDSLTVSADLRALSFRFTVGTAVDAIRIITAQNQVDAPATLALLALSLCGIAAAGRRRRDGAARTGDRAREPLYSTRGA